MFATRLLSGIVLLAAIGLLFWTGGSPLLLAIGLLSLVGVYELFRLWKMQKHPMAVVTYIASAGYYMLLIPACLPSEFYELIPVAALLVLLTIYVTRYPKDTILHVSKALFAFMYVPVMLTFIYLLREHEMGKWTVWLVLISSWGADTCAYCVGKLIGRHHFSELSPKKTIEGCIGGIAGAAIIALGYACFVPLGATGRFMPDVRILFPIVASVSALVSQLGDLSASAIKRNYDAKDYGRIIPGHGGVLDRFDSVIFVAPFIYILLSVFTNTVSC